MNASQPNPGRACARRACDARDTRRGSRRWADDCGPVGVVSAALGRQRGAMIPLENYDRCRWHETGVEARFVVAHCGGIPTGRSYGGAEAPSGLKSAPLKMFPL